MVGRGAIGTWALWTLALSGCGVFESTPSSSSDSALGQSGTGGAGVTGAAGSGGTPWVSPVSPQTSQHWTWNECGRLAPDPDSQPARVYSLAISADGKRLASNAHRVTVWDLAERFEESQPILTTGGGDNNNVALSPDGRFGTFSGDLRWVFDVATGERLYDDVPPPPSLLTACIGSELNFSPDGRYVAGKHYFHSVDVIDTATWKLIGHVATSGCAQGVAFDASSSTVVTPDGSASLAELVAEPPVVDPKPVPGRWVSLTRHPDGSFVYAECMDDFCGTSGLTWEAGGGRHPSVSADGNWLALAGKLLHYPSGEQRLLDELAAEAIFAPNGDVIAGEQDGSLVRFCRAD